MKSGEGHRSSDATKSNVYYMAPFQDQPFYGWDSIVFFDSSPATLCNSLFAHPQDDLVRVLLFQTEGP